MGSIYLTVVAAILLFPWSLLALAILGHLAARLSRRLSWPSGPIRNPAGPHPASPAARL
jgi:hypothetical protein